MIRKAQEAATLEIKERASELMSTSLELSPEPTEAELLMTACAAYDAADIATDVVREMNMLQNVRAPRSVGSDTEPVMTWEAVAGDELRELEVAARDSKNRDVVCLELLPWRGQST
eukprot:SAG31_NODE_10_length_40133_cov_27.863041_22_plen_116_part_00